MRHGKTLPVTRATHSARLLQHCSTTARVQTTGIAAILSHPFRRADVYESRTSLTVNWFYFLPAHYTFCVRTTGVLSSVFTSYTTNPLTSAHIRITRWDCKFAFTRQQRAQTRQQELWYTTYLLWCCMRLEKMNQALFCLVVLSGRRERYRRALPGGGCCSLVQLSCLKFLQATSTAIFQLIVLGSCLAGDFNSSKSWKPYSMYKTFGS